MSIVQLFPTRQPELDMSSGRGFRRVSNACRPCVIITFVPLDLSPLKNRFCHSLLRLNAKNLKSLENSNVNIGYRREHVERLLDVRVCYSAITRRRRSLQGILPVPGQAGFSILVSGLWPRSKVANSNFSETFFEI